MHARTQTLTGNAEPTTITEMAEGLTKSLGNLLGR
jgi:hypothetical protein